jgi:hypothetical protein
VYIVFLVRLRQSVSHPFLLEPVFKDIFTQDDLLSIRARLNAEGDEDAVVEKMGKLCAQQLTSADYATEQNDQTACNSTSRGEIDTEFNINRQINLALLLKNEKVCRFCYEELLGGFEGEVS